MRRLVAVGAVALLVVACPTARDSVGHSQTRDVAVADAGCAACVDAGPNIPAEWHCDPIAYGADASCDCGCGAPDPDCVGGTVAACDSCNCGPPDLTCPGFVDPQDITKCFSTHGHPTPYYLPPEDDICANADIVFDPNEVYAIGELTLGKPDSDAVFALADHAALAVGFGTLTRAITIRADGRLVILEDIADDRPNHLLLWNRDWHVFNNVPEFPGCVYPDHALANDEILPTAPCSPEDFLAAFIFQDGDSTHYITNCANETTFADPNGSILPLPPGKWPNAWHSSGVFLVQDSNYPPSYSVFDPDNLTDTPIAAFQTDALLMNVRAVADGFLGVDIFYPPDGSTHVRVTKVATDGATTVLGEATLDPQYDAPFPTPATLAADGRVFLTVFPPSGSLVMVIVVVDVVNGTTTVAYDPSQNKVQLPGTFSGG